MAEGLARPGVRARSFSSLISVGASLALAVFLVTEAVALPAAWLPLEEAATVLRARGVDVLGGNEIGPLYPVLLAPLERTLSAAAFYETARVASALLWAAAFVPALAIARRCVAGTPAVVAAALAVVVPGAVYSTAVVPDAPAFLLAVTSLALALRAFDDGRYRTLAGAVALAAAAALVRPWLAVLPVALLAAAAVARGVWRRVTRWPYSLAFAAAAGALYAVYFIVGEPSAWDVARASLASAGLAAVGTGIAPWLAAWATIDRGRVRGVEVLLGVAGAPLVVSAGVAAAVDGRIVEERPLVVLSPLVFALGARAWQERAFPAARVAAVAAVTALGLVLVPTSLEHPAVNGAASLALADRALGSTGLAVGVLAVAVLAVAAALVAERRAAVTVAVVAASLVIVGHVGAWTEAHASADDAAAALPEPRDWIDRAAPDARATFVTTGAALESAAQSMLWNRSLRSIESVDPARADPATGALARAPAPLAVAPPGLDLAGDELATGPAGRLLRVGNTLRLAFGIEGLYPDGWSSGDAFYRRFSGSDSQGIVDVVVSRKAWGGPDKPAQVVIVSRPLGGEPFAERITDIHSAQERVVSIPVPPPPFEIKVAVGPTFSPSEYGQPDTRQLGAQLTFTYKPGPG